MKISEIKDGDLLFLNGKSRLAKGIQFFQKLIYGKNSAHHDTYYYLNHVGCCIRDKDNNIVIYEEDAWGKFQASLLNEEYLKEKAKVYIGVPRIEFAEKDLIKLRYEMTELAGDDKFIDYSFKSFFSFMANALTIKFFNKECWLTGEPKGATCSQRIAKLYQQCFNLFTSKKYYKWYPSELAMDNFFILKPLEY
jgi:hypothetical protein